MKWPEVNGSDPYSGLEYDPEIVFLDQEEIIDPMIITGSSTWDRSIVSFSDEQRTLVEGIQVHTCPNAEPDVIYVLDRMACVGSDGLCLVCGGETV